MKPEEFVDVNAFDESFEYTLDSVENDRAMEPILSVIETGDTLTSIREYSEDVEPTVDDEAGIEYTLGSHEQFAGPNQDKTEAEENTDKEVSQSPSRKRVPGRSMLVKTPKRISSIWKKRQKKDTGVEDVISPTRDTDDVPNPETSDESESVQPKDIEAKTPEESVMSASVDGTASVDKDTSKKNQPVPESPSSVIDIILGMTEMELLASASQDMSTDASSRAVDSDQPKPFVLGANTNDCDVVMASTQEESAPQTKEAFGPTPISPPKTRSRLSFLRRRSNNTTPMEDTVVEESEAASKKNNGGANNAEDEAVMLVDKAASLLKERSSESMLSEQAMPESTLNGMVEEFSRSVMDVILGKTATEPPSPDRPIAEVKISVVQQSGPFTEEAVDASAGPLPWMQLVPDKGTADASDGEPQERSIDHGESVRKAVLTTKKKRTKKRRNPKVWPKNRNARSVRNPCGSDASPAPRQNPMEGQNEEEEELVVPSDDMLLMDRLHRNPQAKIRTKRTLDPCHGKQWQMTHPKQPNQLRSGSVQLSALLTVKRRPRLRCCTCPKTEKKSPR